MEYSYSGLGTNLKFYFDSISNLAILCLILLLILDLHLLPSLFLEVDPFSSSFPWRLGEVGVLGTGCALVANKVAGQILACVDVGIFGSS